MTLLQALVLGISGGTDRVPADLVDGSPSLGGEASRFGADRFSEEL